MIEVVGVSGGGQEDPTKVSVPESSAVIERLQDIRTLAPPPRITRSTILGRQPTRRMLRNKLSINLSLLMQPTNGFLNFTLAPPRSLHPSDTDREVAGPMWKDRQNWCPHVRKPIGMEVGDSERRSQPGVRSGNLTTVAMQCHCRCRLIQVIPRIDGLMRKGSRSRKILGTLTQGNIYVISRVS